MSPGGSEDHLPQGTAKLRFMMDKGTRKQPRQVGFLVPLDGSRLAESSLPAAEAFSKRFRSCLTLFHVLEQHAPITIHGDRHLGSRDEAESYLSGVARSLRQKGALSVDCGVHPGVTDDVARGIVEMAKVVRAHMILMCTHGSGGNRGKFFGSIAEQVLELQERPILLAPPLNEIEGQIFAPLKILVLLDLGFRQCPGLSLATALAEAFKAEINLVVVAADQQVSRQVVAKDLERVAAAMSQDGLRTTAEVIGDSQVSDLIARGQEQPHSLFVLTARGPLTVQAMLQGNIAARVAGRTARPFVVVPASEAGTPGTDSLRPRR